MPWETPNALIIQLIANILGTTDGFFSQSEPWAVMPMENSDYSGAIRKQLQQTVYTVHCALVSFGQAEVVQWAC